MDRTKIDKYKKLLKDVKAIDRLENLHELEGRIIEEIVALLDDGSKTSLYLLEKLEKALYLKLSYTQRNNLLSRVLRKSVSGAFSAAKKALV
ncbi:MAG: hypothetical protein KJ732_06530 [Candidatus Margulisbacteria bacterium]|nr:hypothetical protein [Candidatus Margulisiibacteriota bacterium]